MSALENLGEASGRIISELQRYRLWLRLQSTGTCQSLDREVWPVPSPPPEGGDVRVVLKVLTFNRAASLKRLLLSLENALYDDDQVNLDIYVDLDEEKHAEVLEVVNSTSWSHGIKTIVTHQKNVGLVFQWLGCFTGSSYSKDNQVRTSWKSSNLRDFPLPPLPAAPLPRNEFAYILEDDLEQSVYFYWWIKRAIRQYHTNKKNYTPRLYGFSLQQQMLVPCSSKDKRPLGLPLHSNSTPYFYPLVGSWGTLVFPKQWEEFLFWFRQRRLTPSFKPNIDTFKTTQWFRNKPGLWTPWFIRFVAERGYTGLFASYEDEFTMSLNHLEKGINYKKKSKPTQKLVMTDSEIFFRMPPPSDIVAIDFCSSPIENLQQLDGRYDPLFQDTFRRKNTEG